MQMEDMTQQHNWLSVKLRSHCWSDQLDHPDHPNSPTKLDRSSFRRFVPF